MAAIDYKLCDICTRKVIYDADFYERWEHAGAVKVICKGCAETHEVIIRPKSNSPGEGSKT